MTDRGRARRRMLAAGIVAAVLVGGVSTAAPAAAPTSGRPAATTLSPAQVDVSLSTKARPPVPLGESVDVDARFTPQRGRALTGSWIVDVELFLVLPAGPPRAVAATVVHGAGARAATATLRVDVGQWATGPGDARLEARVAGVVEATLPLRIGRPPVVPPRFDNVTRTSGIDAGGGPTDRFGCAGHASGAAWADVDGDGNLDLYTPHQDRPAELWMGRGDFRFVDEADERGVANPKRRGMGATFADVDADGDPDLYVLNDGANRLYLNDGEGRFRDVTRVSGLGDDGPAASAAWADYDRDGHLDLYVVNYGRCERETDLFSNNAPDVLYHNDGDGTFSRRTEALGANATNGLGFAAAWLDADGDGDLDLYLVNDDRLEQGPDDPEWHNQLWHNDGKGAFTNVSKRTGAGLDMFGMGIAVGDPNGDGLLDLAISNIGRNALLLGTASGTYDERARELAADRPTSGARNASITWGLTFLDANLDGWEDLFMPAGDMRLAPSAAEAARARQARQAGMEPGARRPDSLLGDGFPLEAGDQSNAFLVNDRGRRFLDLSAASGTLETGGGDARGVALADIDSDGRVDMFVTSQRGEGHLYRNVTEGTGRWLGVRLHGTQSGSDACGAVATARLSSGRRLVRTVLCGSSSMSSSSDPSLVFGMTGVERVERIDVAWPSGRRSTRQEEREGRYVTMREPGERRAVAPPRGGFGGTRLLLVAVPILGLCGLMAYYVRRRRQRS